MDSSVYWQQMSGTMTALNFLPFIVLLFSTAAFPFIPFISRWWESMGNKLLFCAVCAAAGVLLFLRPTGDVPKVLETYLDYLAFLALVGSLFTVSGGIYISGAFAGLPYVNTLFLGLGAILASLLGTTGASMVLIRPLLRANLMRRHKTHVVVFFIFIVSNCGGLLTPLGDPPLYLGFLRGVPFFWTFRLIPIWALTLLILLFVFHLVDDKIFDGEEINVRGSLIQAIQEAEQPIQVRGRFSVFCLLGILATILLAGYWLNPWLEGRWGAHAVAASKLFQVVVMVSLGLLSYFRTPKEIHEANQFSFAPFVEVMVLFFGIFGSMIPALTLLEAKGQTLAVTHPWQYFWLSGILSSFLDNAPTYLSYAALAAGQVGLSTDHLGALANRAPQLLMAVSCGSVLMGANSYIGNGPNFMVRAIAEQARVKMPSFGGYMLWSGAILIPVFLLMTFIFF
ncbi:MAG TPA: sodium:proton antiporter [bacterium]|nr:sodium:proton antiporter [bacterium]